MKAEDPPASWVTALSQWLVAWRGARDRRWLTQ
jgi:hypothetical protein